MAGLVPAIHVLVAVDCKNVDARDKPGHDGSRAIAARYTAAHTNALPLRLIFPTDGEGKCAVQHSVSVSQ
ncbi:hypothetical protein ABIF68_000458 [Bradyrhizobium japonicum]|jgi:hypothetical protein